MRPNINFICIAIIFLASICIDMSHGRRSRKYKRDVQVKTTPKPTTTTTTTTTTTEEIRPEETQMRREEYIRPEETKPEETKHEERKHEERKEDIFNVAPPPANVMELQKEDLEAKHTALEDLSQQILQNSLLATEDFRVKTNNSPETNEVNNRVELNKYYTISFF